MAKKYLDNVGLDHMWDKIKTYLTNNYAAKSHTHTIAQITNLQTTLNGKANSSHTHTVSQITGLPTVKETKNTTTSGTYTLPSQDVGDIGFHVATFRFNNAINYFKLPAGGRYGIIRYSDLVNQDVCLVQILSGGSTIWEGSTINIAMMYIRLS